MDFVTVEAGSRHIEGIVRLEEECFPSPRTALIVKEEIENPLYHLLAAEKDGSVAGYIGVQEIAGEAYITDIAVTSACRRGGIGEALLRRACLGAKDRGCSFISLEVRRSNAAAIALYEKCGFVPAGLRKNFYHSPAEDAVIYTKYFEEEAK